MGPLVVILAALAKPAPQPLVIYLSPAGDDQKNTGLTADSPVRTLNAAAWEALQYRASHPGASPDTRFVFGAGTYYLGIPLRPLPADGRMTYAAAPGAAVTLSGGHELRDWKADQVNGREVWSAPIPPNVMQEAPPVRELWMNGERRPRARHPNTGYLRIEEPIGAAPDAKWHDGTDAFRFRAEDSPVWDKIQIGSEVVTFTRWVDTHLVLAAYNGAERIARFSRKNMFLLQPGDLYVIENSLAMLDEPGEWWFDPFGARLYYLPRPGEDLASARGVIPVLTTLVEVQRVPRDSVHFEGITFSHARWWFPDDFESTWPSTGIVGFTQAAWGVPGAVVLREASGCTFTNCTFSHLAGYGLEIRDGSRDNRVERCTFTDLGAGAVRIGETTVPHDSKTATGANTIESCTMTEGGLTHHQAVAVWIGQSAANRVRHNHISRFDYTGISIGWTWGYGPSNAGWNVVEFNEVCELGLHPRNAEPPLGDMAGIYTLGKQPGTIIRNNYFHDIAGRTIAWGIYFDEGSSDILACRNVVLRTTHGGFHQHYGRENFVSNNIFAFGRDAQLWRTRREDHNSFAFERNIVIADNDRWFAGDWTENITLGKNLYWRLDGKPVPLPGGVDWATWQGSRDAGSLNTDPGIDAAKPDWSPRGVIPAALAEDSPLKAIGFVPIDLGGVGPRE